VSWQIARIKLLSKGSDLSHPSLMRPISILNVEGRIFFTIYQQRLSSYLLNNNYIQRKVQKTFLDGVAGCIEHTTLTYEALKNAKSHKRSICVSWVDLNNAYGSVRHMQLQFALQRYHVPRQICEIMFRYYEGLIGQVHTDNWISNWFGFEVGLFQGCTASTINFDVAFQPILDCVCTLCGDIGYNFKEANLRVPPLVYADDIEYMTSTPAQNQQFLDAMLF